MSFVTGWLLGPLKSPLTVRAAGRQRDKLWHAWRKRSGEHYLMFNEGMNMKFRSKQMRGLPSKFIKKCFPVDSALADFFCKATE